MLKGKTVVLGVSSSIAAYKIANLASMLVKQHANVRVIMTQNATNFITPTTFETLTGQKCLVDTFDRNFEFQVEHVSLAKQADIFMIAPATANVIAKVSHGLADDMLTTTFLACKAPKYLAPAMNTQMYENPITQDNLNICRKYGMHVIEPASGYLACGDTGAGKMGYAIARAAARRGAEVTLVSGPVDLKAPMGVKLVPVVSAKDMFDAVTSVSLEQDAIIKAAAVADYRPAVVGAEKTKKSDGNMNIALERTDDILAWLGAHRREGQVLCGFSMETQNMLENSRAKLVKKNVDMIVANSLRIAGAGFGTDTNIVTVITKDGAEELALMSKDQVAHELLNRIFAGKH